MCRFIETIRIEDGRPCRIALHSDRANRARREVLNIPDFIDLTGHVHADDLDRELIYKCRITYAQDVESVEIEEYRQRKVRTLMVVRGDNINYNYKYADRSAIDALFDRKGDCDDILILRNGLVTDTSYANIALFDGEQWFTPATPLLEGTMRSHLIRTGVCTPRDIHVGELDRFAGWVIFNAMIDFNPHSMRPTDGIRRS